MHPNDTDSPAMVWERDESLASGLSQALLLGTGCRVACDGMLRLFDEGLNPWVYRTEIVFTGIESTLVVSGLQMLGLMVPELREVIAELITSLHESETPITEEQAAEIGRAVAAFGMRFDGLADEIGEAFRDGHRN